MSVYKLQSLLTLNADTKYDDLASATVTRILYKKPDRTKGYWPATVSGTKLVYAVSNGDIDQEGEWQFQAYFEVGGLKSYGTIFSKQFDKPIQQQ